MLEKIVSKYRLKKLLQPDSGTCAIVDKNWKLIWCSNSFEHLLKTGQLKQKDFPGLLTNSGLKKIKNNKTKTLNLKLKNNALPVSIKLLSSPKRIDGFLIKVKTIGSKKNNSATSVKSDSEFVHELQNILTLLIKENSLSKLSNEILKKCVSLSKSNYAIIVYNLQEDTQKYDFTIYDPDNYLLNFDELKKDIGSNFSFLNKWLSANQKSLKGSKTPNNLASTLSGLLKSESILLTPCIFDNKHIATIIVGKISGEHAGFQIKTVEQFAALLSFSITSFRARELNTALETRLLQSQKLETIGKLSSGMAHDFSNLLSSIFGSVNLLRKRIPDNDNIIKLIDNIESCSIRARDLTKGLLSFGKPTPKRKELINPNLLLTEISKVVNHTFPKNITFENNIEDKLFNILGNGTEIYQILLNLCVNAKESIEKSGKIILSGKNIEIDKKNNVNYPLLHDGKYVWLSVSDSGSGISEDNLLKIFDPYFSTKMKESGSGLGLYVTYGIIKAHNGEVEVSSKVGKGTTFDVFIPAYEPTVQKNSDKEKIILLAEDEVMLSDLLAELLESVGYNVIKVYNGNEVIKLLTEELKVNMVILDYNMPGLNGLECSEKIRSLNMDMPIILSSGSVSLNNEVRLQKKGITDFISKPYEFDTLLATIKRLI
jgi:signal transduction histidine kinase/CheY-like chemotaxis protein